MASIAMFIYWEIWLYSWYIHIKVIVGGEITLYHCYIMLYYVPIKVQSSYLFIKSSNGHVAASWLQRRSSNCRSLNKSEAFKSCLARDLWWVFLMENPNLKRKICWKIPHFRESSIWFQRDFIGKRDLSWEYLINHHEWFHGKTDWLSQLSHYIPIFIPNIYPHDIGELTQSTN